MSPCASLQVEVESLRAPLGACRWLEAPLQGPAPDPTGLPGAPGPPQPRVVPRAPCPPLLYRPGRLPSPAQHRSRRGGEAPAPPPRCCCPQRRRLPSSIQSGIRNVGSELRTRPRGRRLPSRPPSAGPRRWTRDHATGLIPAPGASHPPAGSSARTCRTAPASPATEPAAKRRARRTDLGRRRQHSTGTRRGPAERRRRGRAGMHAGGVSGAPGPGLRSSACGPRGTLGASGGLPARRGPGSAPGSASPGPRGRRLAPHGPRLHGGRRAGLPRLEVLRRSLQGGPGAPPSATLLPGPTRVVETPEPGRGPAAASAAALRSLPRAARPALRRRRCPRLRPLPPPLDRQLCQPTGRRTWRLAPPRCGAKDTVASGRGAFPEGHRKSAVGFSLA